MNTCSHQSATMVRTEQVGLLGTVEHYECDTPGCNGTFTVRSWAEAEDCGFAPDTDED